MTPPSSPRAGRSTVSAAGEPTWFCNHSYGRRSEQWEPHRDAVESVESLREAVQAILDAASSDRDNKHITIPLRTPSGALRTEWERLRVAFIRAEAAASPAGPEAVPQSEREGLRPSVLSFALLMERVLRDNDHKGGWQDCEPDWLLTRLRQEVNELDEAMRKGTIARHDESGRTSDWPADVPREAADVANFAMMIVDVLDGFRAALASPAHPDEE